MKTDRIKKLTIANEWLMADVEALLAEGRTVQLPATGRSMFPFVRGGRDSVILQRTDLIVPGDIVLARLAPKKYVMHRVLRRTEQGFILMGDGNICQTERCQTQDICGKAIRIIRNGRGIDCASPTERCKVRAWLMLRPVRKYILGICNRWNGITHFCL